MRIALAVAALVIGLPVLVGQLVSMFDFALAQRLGLQEKSDHTAPLYRGLELNTARWDVAVLWTLLPAAVLMLADLERGPRPLDPLPADRDPPAPRSSGGSGRSHRPRPSRLQDQHHRSASVRVVGARAHRRVPVGNAQPSGSTFASGYLTD